MDDTEQAQFHDDHDVEITDLPEETEAAGRLRTSPGRARQASPLLEKWLFRQQLSPRQRVLQLAAITGSVALIALIVLASSASMRNALITGIVGRQPTSTPALFPSTDLFYIQGAPSWGHASLDGHTLSRLPIVGKDQPLRLARGSHIIRWYADPFEPQTCLITIPALVGTDACVSHQVAQLKPDLFASIITFSESLDSLPGNQFEALARATRVAVDALQSTEMVRPGEQYIDSRSNLGVATARQPMRAMLNFQLDIALTSTATCVNSLGSAVISSCLDCRRFCTAPDQVFSATPTDQPWSVLALVSATWKFSTLDGHIVAQNQPDSPDGQDEQLVELNITWDSTGWHVRALPSNPGIPAAGNEACATAMEDIGQNGGFDVTGGNVEEAVNWQFAAGSNLALGCLAAGTSQQSTAGQPNLPQAYLLHRFGVIVAANAAAHSYWPFLPLADTYEQRLVQQLATQLPSQQA